MPDAASAPPFFDIVVTAWRDAVTAWRRLPLQSAIACAIFLAEALLRLAFDLDSELLAADLAFSSLTGLLLLPFQIALFRSYILGEPARGYAFDFSPRFRRFLLWSMIVWIPIVMLYVVAIAGPSAEEGTGVMTVLLFVIFGLTLAAAVIGTALLFPAIAVDAPGAILGNALADLRGHVSCVLAVVFAALLPALALPFVLSSLFGMEDSSQSAMSRIIEALFGFVITTIFTVGVARLYDAFAVRLKADAGDERRNVAF